MSSKTGNSVRMSPVALAVIATVANQSAMANKANEETLQLDKYVVTATQTSHELTTAPASMSVITGKELQETPVSDISDAIRHTEGIHLEQKGGNGRRGINIRGLSSAYTLVLVNGRRVDSNVTLIRGNDFDLSTIPVDHIDRIEIVRGPMSALYGSEALGGVVNIITKKGSNQFDGNASIDFSSPFGSDGGNETRNSVSLRGPLVENKLFYSLSVDAQHRDAWTPYQDDPSTTNAQEDKLSPIEKKELYSVAGNLNWKINDQQTLDLDITHNKDERDGEFLQRNKNSITDQEIRRYTYGLTHSGQWAWGDSQLRYYREDMNFTERGASGAGKMEQSNQTVDGFVSKLFGDHLVTTGAEYRHTKLENARDFKTSGEATVSQKAVFLQDEWLINPEWSFTLGGRLDDHENFGTHFSPRGYLVYTPTAALIIKGGVGKAFKAPSLLQLTEEYRLKSCKGSCFLRGNPDLDPEVATSYELGINYQQPSWHVGATIFRTDIDDLIQRQSSSQQVNNTITYENVDAARIDGLELSAGVDLTSTVSLSANYTYTDARDKNTDEILHKRPRENANLRLDWQVTDTMGAFVRTHYVGEQEDSIKGKGDVDLQGYALTDIGMTYQLTKDLQLRTGITNIEDKTQGYDSDYGFSERGRTIYAGVSLSF
ncbi:TonB-dependent receptor domain-containing protein [Zooshikella ganghwensis]|uniref:TonB-dependent receptor domain-containing protein n=1 Tax=Zooshikella ganghwensis TaxID=202772 RepID=UPI00146FB18F|nr:TonB-dependent receptor [Zooshikella ganghwensis]